MLRAGIFVFNLIIEEIISVFTIEYDVSCGPIVYDLYFIEVRNFHNHFVDSFYHK